MAKLSDLGGYLTDKYRAFRKTTFLDTGSLIFNAVMGGGLPEGKILELSSEAGVGKTTAVLSMCLQLVKSGYRVMYIDSEAALTTGPTGLLRGVGLEEHLFNAESNPDGLFWVQSVQTYGEIEDILDRTFSTNAFKLIVVDSVAALMDDKYLYNALEIKKEGTSIVDSRPAEDARIMKNFLRKYKSLCDKKNCTMILINQLRTALNMTGGPSKMVTTGGKSMEYFPDIIMSLAKPNFIYEKRHVAGSSEEQQIAVGCDVILTASKNKMTNGKIGVPVTIIFGKGISNVGSYTKWLPNKLTTNQNGDLVPMLKVKGGGYNIITLNGVEYPLRGSEAVTNFVREHFDEIKACFSEKDFQLVASENTEEDIVETSQGSTVVDNYDALEG